MSAPTIAERFPTAATSGPPTPAQREAVEAIRNATIALARAIDDTVPEGRDKSIALTALEDVLMRANRGVFTGHPAGKLSSIGVIAGDAPTPANVARQVLAARAALA